jgi:hypothetical protein
MDRTGVLMRRGTDFLGSETAILCGAMSWWMALGPHEPGW